MHSSTRRVFIITFTAFIMNSEYVIAKEIKAYNPLNNRHIYKQLNRNILIAPKPSILRFDWVGPNSNNSSDPFRVAPGNTLKFTLSVQGPQSKNISVQLSSTQPSVIPVSSSVIIYKNSSSYLTSIFYVTIPSSLSVTAPITVGITARTSAGSKMSQVVLRP